MARQQEKIICVIPAYQRPEFLWHCLDRIKKCDDVHKVTFLFMLDFGCSNEVKKLANDFPLPKRVFMQPKVEYRATKQSFNVLQGYRLAYEMGATLICMIEEDVMVATDFFTWHINVHKQKELFCSIATRNNNTKYETTDDLGAYYVCDGDYQSLGVAFNPKIIKALQHYACHAYYKAPMQYCAEHFPGSKVGPFFAEQDGLIRRIQEIQVLPVAFPDVPRAFHAGFYGKNRGRRVVGTYEQLRVKVGSIIYDRGRMKAAVDRPEYYEDSTPVNLNNKPIDYPLYERTEIHVASVG